MRAQGRPKREQAPKRVSAEGSLVNADTAGALAGRHAMITGAAGDIGRAMAQRFAAAGARLTLLDRDAEELAREVAANAVAYGKALVCACDVADPEATRAAVAAAEEAFGPVRILVNNAAPLTPSHTVVNLPIDDWNRTIGANLTGAFLMCRWTIPGMKAAGGGVIINIASQLGHVGAPGRAAYSASKAGLIALSRGLAIDHADDGIRAVSISPGAVLTSRLVRRYGSERAVEDSLAPLHLVRRIGRPAEIAAAALFLASDEASFITGTDLLADGGYTAR